MRILYTRPRNQEFFQSYLPLIATAHRLGIIAQILSAITEYGVLYSLVYQAASGYLRLTTLIPISHSVALLGTLFIELGLRRLLPYTMGAILNRRFNGLHLIVSIMVFSVTSLLLAASLLTSFYGSKHIVSQVAPVTEVFDNSELQREKDLSIQNAQNRWRMDSSLIQQLFLVQKEKLDKQYQVKLTRNPNPSNITLMSWEADRTSMLTDMEEKRINALTEVLQKKEASIRESERNYTSKLEHQQSEFLQSVSLKKAMNNRYGSNLGWITVSAIIVLIFCVGIEETYKKGAGIEPTIEITPHSFSPGVWSELTSAISATWEQRTRDWIKHSFPSTETEVQNTITANTSTDIPTTTQNRVEKECDYCGTVFSLKRRDQRFCSGECRVTYHTEQHNGRVFLPATFHRKVKSKTTKV